MSKKGHYIVKFNNKCNSNCCFCADTKKDRNLPDRPFEGLVKDLRKAAKKFDSIIISGGEPTIHPRIIEYIQNARKAGFRKVTITTNGFMMYYREFLKRILSAGADSFIVSFQTINPDDYSKITGVKKAHEYVTGGLENLRKNECDTRVNTVIHKLNMKFIPETVEYLKAMEVSSIQLSFMNPIGSGIIDGKSSMAVSYSETMPWIRKAFRKASEIGFEELWIENFPPCIAGNLSDRISDARKPYENKGYYNRGKIKPRICRECIHVNSCDGFWKAYFEQFGDSEIVPVRRQG